MSVSFSDVLVLSLASFLGNVGVSITGFGMAIVFLFVWQLAVICGYSTTYASIEYAVFIQSLALCIAQPLILPKANIKTHGTRALLKLFIPITILSTPLGQLAAEYTDKVLIQTVGGFIVLGMAIFEIHRNWDLVVSTVCGAKEDKAVTEGTAKEQETVAVQLGDVAVVKKDEIPELTMTRTIATWTLSMGFLSGFLGGLCGIRGPPLIIFFMHSPVKMPKKVQKANGAAITVFNVGMRVLFYAIESVSGGAHHFEGADWPVYVGVCGGSVAGILVGQVLFERLKDSQAVLKTILSFFLLLCGVSLLVTAFW